MGRRKGTGTIFYSERHDAWIYRYWVEHTDGTKKRKQGQALNKKQAERDLAQKIRDTAGRKVPTDITLREWLKVWESRLEVKPNTKAQYRVAAERVSRVIGHKRLADVTPHDVENAMRQSGSPRKAVDDRKILKLAFREAQRERRVPDNPADLARPAKYTPQHKATIFSAEDMQKILNATRNPVYRAFFAFLWATGARPWSEAAPLKWSEIERNEHGLWFRGAKTAQGRELRPIPNFIVPHLIEIAVEGDDRVFPKELIPRNVRARWHTSLRKAGFEPTRIYDTRNSAATRIMLSGENMEVGAKLLGHTNSEMMREVYAKVNQKDLREVVERLFEKR